MTQEPENQDPKELTAVDNLAVDHLIMLIKTITFLIIFQYIVDVVFHIRGETNTANARISDLTSLVFALVFYLSFSNLSSRIESINFRSEKDVS